MSARVLAAAVLVLLASGCGRPSQEEPQGDAQALDRAVRAPQQRAEAVGDEVEAAAKRQAEAIEAQTGGD